MVLFWLFFLFFCYYFNRDLVSLVWVGGGILSYILLRGDWGVGGEGVRCWMF